MKHQEAIRTRSDQSARGIEAGAANDDDVFETELQKISADAYERRRRTRARLRRGELWIAVGLYLILCSIAFLIL